MDLSESANDVLQFSLHVVFFAYDALLHGGLDSYNRLISGMDPACKLL